MLYDLVLLAADALQADKIRQATVFIIALILSVTVHEFGHAFVADRLGDGTPRHQGRVTLNPIAHADIFGTILIPLFFVITNPSFLFGWGRPVLVNPLGFTRKYRMKVSHMMVALAGPIMNILLALIVTVIYAITLATGLLQSPNLAHGVIMVIQLNWVLCFFNMIPCPPLDGGTVLAGLLPDKYDHINQFLRQYGFWILLGLLITGIASYFAAPALWITNITVGLVHSLVL